ncbi:hypothetical protein QJ043_02350 [Olsenella sp. YH-ols2217]|uniref:Uncharacterized protein n=1 Tax=Kribbibacterium absianum TaxID=3044210 RepID=A0ABT6ZIR8_9ACTN|nr:MULTISPECIES: hypothetical protein [unclassified Olsenella]MDJ1121434.1 hypothetical protein [Olsenella sp. YH-ols2216]MDJ1128924.1 hypothetical protein [Olsenella sp. YH-ols2217]
MRSHAGWSRLLQGLAYVFRVLAVLTSLLVLALCLGSAVSLGVLDWVVKLDATIPSGLSGVLVYATPLGGAFRGDFFIAALVLFVCDWACCRLSAALR